uniref:Major capsid protein n=1 Tax=uncultured prokaryote TaxID=198431 RepID=A0A0H5PYK9_9ZZZZ|nr:hypothetical protein [uncultured prokaryote]
MAPSILYPVGTIHCIPKGDYRINISSAVQALVAKNPILNGYKVRISAFWCPYYLYVPELRLNNSYAGNIASGFADAVFPQFTLGAPRSAWNSNANWTVGPGSLLNCIGLPVGYYNPYVQSSLTESFQSSDEMLCAMPVLQYWDIFRNYFMNTAEDDVRFVGSVSVTDSQLREPRTYSMKGSDLESNFQSIFSSFTTYQRSVGLSSFYKYRSSTTNELQTLAPRQIYSCINGGLFLKSLPFDFVNARLNSTRYANALARSMVSISNDKLSMQDLVDGQRLYDYFLKAAWVGDRFDQWIKAEFGLDVTRNLDIPLLLRTFSYNLNFGTLYGTADGSNSNSTSYLGSQVGTASSSLGRPQYLRWKAKDYGDIVFIASIEPDVMYMTNVDPFLYKTRMTDVFTPSYDRMGVQGVSQFMVNALRPSAGLPTSQVLTPNASQAGKDITGVPPTFIYGSAANGYPKALVGYHPTWSEYRFRYSRAMGSFGDVTNQLNTWIATPSYGIFPDTIYQAAAGSVSSNSSVYGNPSDFLRAFPDTTASSRPFLFALECSVEAWQPIANNQISHL